MSLSRVRLTTSITCPIGRFTAIRSSWSPGGISMTGQASGTSDEAEAAGTTRVEMSTRIANWNEARLPNDQISHVGGGSLIPNARMSYWCGPSDATGLATGLGVGLGPGTRTAPEPDGAAPHGLTTATRTATS